MVLADNEDASDHPFLYARVLGIFHANVVYMGSQVVDYTARPYEFLWVRWFDFDPKVSPGGWSSSAFDRLRFPPMAQPDSFSFLDPEDMVRSCHSAKFPPGQASLRWEGLVAICEGRARLEQLLCEPVSNKQSLLKSMLYIHLFHSTDS